MLARTIRVAPRITRLKTLLRRVERSRNGSICWRAEGARFRTSSRRFKAMTLPLPDPARSQAGASPEGSKRSAPPLPLAAYQAKGLPSIRQDVHRPGFTPGGLHRGGPAELARQAAVPVRAPRRGIATPISRILRAACSRSRWKVPQPVLPESIRVLARRANSGMVQLRVTAIPELAIRWSSAFSRLTDRPSAFYR